LWRCSCEEWPLFSLSYCSLETSALIAFAEPPSGENTDMEAAIDGEALQRASAKVRRYLLPFLVLCYFAAYLDRVNVGFAALTMNADLGIGPEAYGFTAGIFFLGYCLFEVPSNLLLEQFGARRWIARIMITWGLVSAAMAFVSTVTELSIVRFLLGVAEAGFFPGIIFYLTFWVSSSERARIVTVFMAAIPVSSLIGAPVSGWLLDAFAGVGALKGWQWLFMLEAVPSIVLGVAAFWMLPDRPRNAPWLTADEALALEQQIEFEMHSREAIKSYSLGSALTDRRVLALGLIYFGLATGMYGLSFWLPQMIKSFGLSNTNTGLVTAVPYLVAAIVMVLWGRHSDARGERPWHIAIPAFAGGLALIAGTTMTSLVPAVALLTIAAAGTFTALPLFWTLPTAMLTGAAAAGGIALINAIGNIGGFIGPYLVGWLKGQGASTAIAVSSLASFAIAAGLAVLALGHDARLEHAPADASASS
jgi:MFS transporter, ACS family, tartrate transporter